MAGAGGGRGAVGRVVVVGRGRGRRLCEGWRTAGLGMADRSVLLCVLWRVLWCVLWRVLWCVLCCVSVLWCVLWCVLVCERLELVETIETLIAPSN
jgi:hypothetical protein